MLSQANLPSVEAAPKAFGAATLQSVQEVCSHGAVRRLGRTGSNGVNAPQGRGYNFCELPCSSTPNASAAFTLTELLVTMGVLVLLVLLFTQLLNSSATIMTLGNKRMDADSQARQLLDRMAIDFAQMVKRTDVDYYLKSSSGSSAGTPPDCTTCTDQTKNDATRSDPTGNDQIAFFSATSGYYPTPGSQSPISLVAYRVNSDSMNASYNKMERMGKGFIWNGVSSSYIPILFLDSATVPTTTIANKWPAAVSKSLPDPDGHYETTGPQIFRFEYYYLLKGQTVQVGAPTPTPTPNPPIFSDTPWDTRISGHTNVIRITNGVITSDVTAIIVDIAVIDPKSKVLVTDAQIATLAGTLIDYGGSAVGNCPSPNWQTPGELRRQWQCALDSTTSLPRPAISGIRVYERYFYLNQ